jgi:hypothetical protein
MNKTIILTGLFCLGLCLFEAKSQQYNLRKHLGFLEKGLAASYVQEFSKDFANMDKQSFSGWKSLSAQSQFISPLIISSVGYNRIECLTKWCEYREWIKGHFQYWILGNMSSSPDDFEFIILKDSLVPNKMRHQLIQVKFGPLMKCQMYFKPFIPLSENPLPVILTQLNHLREEQQIYSVRLNLELIK